jgi:hypothetical protein
MRRLWLLAVVIVAAIAISAAGAATTVVEEDVQVFFLPVCVNGVVADAASGTTHRVTVTTTVVNEGRTMFRVVLTEQGTLLGTLDPNQTYQYKLTQPFMNTGFINAQIVATPNAGPGNTTLVTSLFKALINGNGEVVLVEEEPLTTECK